MELDRLCSAIVGLERMVCSAVLETALAAQKYHLWLLFMCASLGTNALPYSVGAEWRFPFCDLKGVSGTVPETRDAGESEDEEDEDEGEVNDANGKENDDDYSGEGSDDDDDDDDDSDPSSDGGSDEDEDDDDDDDDAEDEDDNDDDDNEEEDEEQRQEKVKSLSYLRMLLHFSTLG